MPFCWLRRMMTELERRQEFRIYRDNQHALTIARATTAMQSDKKASEKYLDALEEAPRMVKMGRKGVEDAREVHSNMFDIMPVKIDYYRVQKDNGS